MEGPLEVKDSTRNVEEPIKLEAPVRSPDSSEHSDGAASPPPNCSICLGKLINTSFTDSCLHQFCFTCLLQWSKIKTECPLCKQTFKSIIHNVRSEEDYDQYHVPRELASQIPQPQVMASFDLNFEVDGHWDVGARRFFYRTTMTGNRRHGTLLNPEQVARREQLPSIAPQVSREERRRRRTNPADYRRTVYRLGIWSASLPDMFGRFRESSADYYRREPRELNRLIPWLNRELEVLLSNSASHIAYVMNLILEGLSQYDIRSPEFRDLVRPHIGVHTDHFAHELYTYARTNFDLVGYDQSVTYLPQGLTNELVSYAASPPSSSSSSSSDDSSIRLLDDNVGVRVNSTMPGVGPHPINMPGPSTVAQAFSIDPPYNVPDVLTISSNSSSSDDDCEVIGYVKPRHERTPEIIELVSSDPEEVPPSLPVDNLQTSSTFFGECAQPSTSHTTKRGPSLEGRISSSTDSDSDSDSDYTCRRSRRYQNHTKKSSKRNVVTKRHNRSPEGRSHTRGSRNLSSSGESESRRRKSKRSAARGAKRRISSSSDSSSPETEAKKAGDKRSRSKAQYSIRGTVCVRKDLIKREDRYTPDDSSSSDSSSDSDDSAKIKSRAVRKSKRKYVSSSSDFDAEISERVTRTRVKSRKLSDSTVSSKEPDRKEQRYKENRQSRQRSSSESSYASQKEKRTNSRRRDLPRYGSEYGNHEERSSASRDLPRKEQESKSKSKPKRMLASSSESEEDQFRSSSQCSNHSSMSYVHWKRSKHKDRYKSKERKRSSSRTFNSSQPSSSVISSSSACSKPETHSAPKHSDSKSNSSSKGRHKSHKSHKESKHRRSESGTKSKSRKRGRRLRSSSSSNSE